jgi:hypothetical protein
MFGAARKIVRVVINGEETVSKASDEANAGLSGFIGRARTAIAGLAALGVGAALGGFFKKAIEESLGASQEMTRLQSVISGTGASFEALRPRVLDTITSLNRMTTFSQGDLRNALGTMIAMTGDAEGSIENLGLATDLAAARGIPLEQATEAIAKAMAGNETALRKMMPALKDSDDLFGDLRLAVDGAAEAAGQTLAGQLARAKDQFGEFANAVGDAILGSRELSGSGNILVDLMVSLQDWVGENSEQIGKMTDAIVLMAKGIGEVLGPAFRIFGTLATPALRLVIAIVTELSFAVRSFAIFAQDTFGKAMQVIGGFAGGVAGLLKKVGIDLNVEGVEQMKKFGATMQQEADGKWQKMTADHAAFWSRTTRLTEEGERNSTTAMRTGTRDQVAELETRTTKAKQAVAETRAAVEAQLGPSLKDLIAVTNGEIVRMGEVAERSLSPTPAAAFAAAMGPVIARAAEVRDRINGWTPALEGAADTGRDLAGEVVGIARGAIDAGQAFGVLDTQGASLLNSVMNVGQAMGKLLAGDMTSIAGIIGGVANIAKQIIGGDAARKRLIADNTRGLDRLRSEIGNLRLNVTGEQFKGVWDAIGSVIGRLAGGRGAANQTDIIGALRSRGLSLSDLEKVANELGVKIKTESGALSVDGIRQLLRAMAMTEFGQFGTDFGDRLESTTRGFDIKNIGNAQQIADLFGLGAEFSPALRGVFDATDLAGTRSRLGQLFQGLIDGSIGPEGFGGLTSTQFLDLITDLIGRIDTVMGEGTGNAPVAVGEGDVLVPGVGVVPAETVSAIGDVFAAYALDTVPLFTQQVELQMRIADASEATAQNTATTVSELRALRETIASGVLRDGLDEALEAERYALAVQQGAAVTF